MLKKETDEIEKLYYTMGEVTAMFNAAPSQIRYYEAEFNILKPKKNKKGNRLFTQKDIRVLKILFSLIKDKGFTLAGARNYLKTNKREANKSQTLINSLERIKAFLIEVREGL